MLSEDVFERSFGILLSRFSKKYNADLAAVYFNRCRKIPDEAFREIINAMIDHEKYFPTPGAIKDSWYLWLEQRPHKKQFRERTECLSCGSQGYYIHRRFDVKHDKTYQHIARCGYCQNWKGILGETIPMANRADLENIGCEIIEFWKNQDVTPIYSIEECKRLATKRLAVQIMTDRQREKRIAHLRRQAVDLKAQKKGER